MAKTTSAAPKGSKKGGIYILSKKQKNKPKNKRNLWEAVDL